MISCDPKMWSLHFGGVQRLVCRAILATAELLALHCRRRKNKRKTTTGRKIPTQQKKVSRDFIVYYFVFWRVRNIVMSVSLCGFVCLSVCSHISKTQRPNFMKFSVQIACGRDFLFLCRRCDTLCASGFLDDVMRYIIGLMARNLYS